MSELKYGNWAFVWDDGTKKHTRIYLGFDGQYHWAVNGKDTYRFLNKDMGLIRMSKWEHAEPYKPEIDWTKVPANTKVLVSDSKKNWLKGYWAVYLGNACAKYCVFGDTTKICEQKDAKWIVCFKYCKFPDGFKIPQEWLKEK